MIMKRTLLWFTAGAVMTMAGMSCADEGTKAAPASTQSKGEPAAISLKVSGPGAVNDSTIKVGEKVSVDLYFSNDKPRKAFTTGFKLSSPDIKTVEHPTDSGMGVNDNGDIKGHNGWNDNSVWDLKGLLVNKGDWDGTLPDYVGLGGVAVKQRFNPQLSTKQISFDLVVPEAGTLIVDSVFFPPGGFWKFSDNEKPAWKGPYKFKVVK